MHPISQVETLKAIRDISHNYQQTKYYVGTVSKSVQDFFMIQQQNKEKITEYTKQYKTTKEIMESRFGKLDMTNSMSNTDEYKAAGTDHERKEIVEDAYQRVVAYNFLMSTNLDKVQQLNKELANDYAKGDNKYPENLEKAVEMLANYRAPVAFNKNKYNKTCKERTSRICASNSRARWKYTFPYHMQQL